MKTVLITGASGFIGSHLVETALEKKFQVYAGVRKTSSLKYLQDKRIHFIYFNLLDKQGLYKTFSQLTQNHIKFDYIIHCAGITKAFKVKDYDVYNYQATKNLIATLIITKHIPKKFIFISSLAVYGPGDELNFLPIQSNHKRNPLSAYAKSKYKVEKYLQTLKKFPYLIFSPTITYGPRDKDLLPYFKLIVHRIEPYFGTREQHLSFVYVKDLVDLMVKSLTTSLKNRVFLVSDGHSYSIKIFHQIVKNSLQKKTITILFPKWFLKISAWVIENIFSLFGYFSIFNLEKVKELTCKNWICDITPLKKKLHFVPKYNLTEGMTKTIEWYKKNHWL